ncbi:MAG: MFS transporter [Lachnospiraceae bacterium]|nr:MFS transporter [Lachnospiraceae bacterium]
MNQNNTKSNFGRWGWSMIIYCGLSYYLAAALATDTLNYYPAAFTALRGWDTSMIDLCNVMTGIGGWLGVVAAFIFSTMTAKKGSKFMAVFGNILSAVLTVVFALTNNTAVFLAMVILITLVSGNIQLNLVPNNVMNVWFPKKKGLALGWASMGLPLCTATILVIFNIIGNPVTAYLALAVVMLIFGIVSIFWLKDTPEEVGATPDNEPIDLETAKALKETQIEEAKKFTLKALIKMPNTWYIGIGHGILWMTTLGLVSNFIPKLMMVGVPQETAIGLLTLAAVVGIVGSYIWGWIDQKFGTKLASIIYGVWYLVALLLMIFLNGSTAMAVIVAVFVGFGIGGIGNLIPSIIGTCYGRFGFVQANRIIAPVNTAVRSIAFIIIGAVGVEHLNTAYVIFFVLSAVAVGLIALIKQPKME